jgi:hypothetical protein
MLHFTHDRYIITTGAVTALFSSLLGSVLPQVHKNKNKNKIEVNNYLFSISGIPKCFGNNYLKYT